MILTILKIIGIIILVILLLIILLLALVLLTPIRYRFNAEYFDEPDVLATVRYALVGLNAQVTFKENELQYTVRALGGVIMTNTGARLSWLGRKISGERDYEDRADLKNENERPYGNDESDEGFQNKDIIQDNSGSIIASPANIDKAAEDDNSLDNKKADKKHKKKVPISKRLDEGIRRIKEKYRDIKAKISKINKKKDALVKVFKSKRFEKAKKDVIKYIKELLRVIKPKLVEGRVRFGMNEPAMTGEILGGVATLIPLFDDFLDIRPDFEKQVIEGILKGYGKIRLWPIVKVAVKVLLNKNLMTVIKRVQTIAEA